MPVGPTSEVDVAVTVTGDAPVSGLAAPDAERWRPSPPLTEPLVDVVVGFVIPPALAEVREYNEDVDMRLFS